MIILMVDTHKLPRHLLNFINSIRFSTLGLNDRYGGSGVRGFLFFVVIDVALVGGHTLIGCNTFLSWLLIENGELLLWRALLLFLLPFSIAVIFIKPIELQI
jgi:hypothetical protein